MVYKCPICGSLTRSHIEYNNGFDRVIYNCDICYWTNRYMQIEMSSKTTAVNNYPAGIYYTTNTISGGLQNAK